MSENFFVEIISPNKLVLKEETEEVTLPCFEGEMGILKDHISLITFLRPGVITIKKENKEKKFFVEEGTVEFSNNNLLILTSTAKNFFSLFSFLIVITPGLKNVIKDI
jgi:F-type H+-transporting ATPase subunit epsilon/F-type H+-transporting ATPase subunit delta